MNGKKLDEKLLEDAHILLHPTRYRIVELLAEKRMHIDGISRALDVREVSSRIILISCKSADS